MLAIKSRFSLALIAGVAIFFAVLHTEFLLAWVCMVPLFAGVENAGLRAAARMGFLTGVVVSVFSFWWMIEGAETFTGSSVWYGVGVFVLCTLFFSLFWSLLLWTYARLRRGALLVGGLPVYAEALLAGSLWVCAEAGLQWLFKGMPWFLFRTGNALAGNLYAIQPFCWLGVHAGTFVVVSVNCAIGRSIARRAWKRLWWPLAAILVYLGVGWGILQTTTEPRGAGFSLALLCEQIPPALQWDSASGNRLVNRLLDLDRTATVQRPDMALWSESAIPWTYRPDDDLVREILRISAPAGITHILGMNTAVADGIVYNSAYCLAPAAPAAHAPAAPTTAARYDKQVLLLGVEQRWWGLLIPFFSSNGYAVQPGPCAGPLPTPFGAAGILICNESAVPSAAASAVRKGARYLLNLGNDGWFSDTYLVSLHFYNARLRAVETRRDIAVNSNNGISGLIDASGRIREFRQGAEPFVSVVKVHPRDAMTPAVRLPWLPAALCGIYLLFILYYKRTPK